MRDRGCAEVLDDVVWAGGTADYCVRWVIRVKGAYCKLLTQHGGSFMTGNTPHSAWMWSTLEMMRRDFFCTD